MHIKTGAGVIDSFLNGGYENDIITTIYGPAGSGKTNLCILAAVTTALSGKKVIYIDTEGGFSLERLKQITPKYKDVLDNTLFIRPASFEEQKKAFETLRLANLKDVGLIIVDSIAMLYRLRIGKKSEIYDTNKDLCLQLGFLTEIARKKNIPVLLTNQVYASFEERDRVNMVGGDILKYSSKCLIELKNLNNKRAAVLRKHRSLPENRNTVFVIRNEGIFGVDEAENLSHENIDAAKQENNNPPAQLNEIRIEIDDSEREEQ